MFSPPSNFAHRKHACFSKLPLIFFFYHVRHGRKKHNGPSSPFSDVWEATMAPEHFGDTGEGKRREAFWGRQVSCRCLWRMPNACECHVLRCVFDRHGAVCRPGAARRNSLGDLLIVHLFYGEEFLCRSHHSSCRSQKLLISCAYRNWSTVKCLAGPTDSPHFRAAASCRADLRAWGCDAPEWEALSLSLAHWPPWSLACWQFERRRGSMTHPWSCGPSRFSCSAGHAPSARWSSFRPPFSPLCLTLHSSDSHLLRRLHLPLHCPPAFASVAGHHRASCSRAGVPRRRGLALESAVARVCRESGARVSASVFVRDLDLSTGATDQRRIEVIAEELPVSHGAQFAMKNLTSLWFRHSALMMRHTVVVPPRVALP